MSASPSWPKSTAGDAVGSSGRSAVEANGATALVGEQSNEQGGLARASRPEVVHRHDLDHAPAQHRARDETVGGRVVAVPQRQLDDPPDVVARAPRRHPAVSTPERSSNAGAVDRPGGAHDPVGSDHVAVGGDDPGRPSLHEADRGHETVGDHVEVRPRHRRLEIRLVAARAGLSSTGAASSHAGRAAHGRSRRARRRRTTRRGRRFKRSQFVVLAPDSTPPLTALDPPRPRPCGYGRRSESPSVATNPSQSAPGSARSSR